MPGYTPYNPLGTIAPRTAPPSPTTTPPATPPPGGTTLGGIKRTGFSGWNPATRSFSGGLGTLKPIPPGTSGISQQVGGGPAPTSGTESGPGILQQWFNERANGTDPGYEYATQRGLTALNNQYAAGGDAFSGAAQQGKGDFMANMAAQREAQLDALAGGASGERQGMINSMLQYGLGLAGGEAGTMGGYDLGAANSLNNIGNNLAAIGGQKAGAIQQQGQNFVSNLGL